MDESKPKTDNGNVHLFWICIVVAMLVYNWRSNAATLKQVGKIQEWAQTVESSAKKLHDTTNRFNSENWRDVVPDVQYAASALHGTTEFLCIEVDKLEEALKPPPPEDGGYDPR